MSRSKTKITKPLASFESTLKIKRGGKLMSDTYARITDSLLLSEAFQDLKPHIQMLYIFMREQEIGKRKPNRDFDETSSVWEAVRSEQCFYFPWHTAKSYSNRYKGNSSRLYKDIDVLIEHGFIEKTMSGRATRDNSVYKYSDKWQQWRKLPP